MAGYEYMNDAQGASGHIFMFEIANLRLGEMVMVQTTAGIGSLCDDLYYSST